MMPIDEGKTLRIYSVNHLLRDKKGRRKQCKHVKENKKCFFFNLSSNLKHLQLWKIEWNICPQIS